MHACSQTAQRSPPLRAQLERPILNDSPPHETRTHDGYRCTRKVKPKREAKDAWSLASPIWRQPTPDEAEAERKAQIVHEAIRRTRSS